MWRVSLLAGSLLLACSSGSSTRTSGDSPELVALRQTNLQLVNNLRAKEGVAPLVLDDGLNAFAMSSSSQLSTDHQPHANFSANAAACKCDPEGENQGDQNGWPTADPTAQITQVVNLMFAEGPGGGHHDNIMDPRFKRLGVGLVFVDGPRNLYFTNDFGP